MRQSRYKYPQWVPSLSLQTLFCISQSENLGLFYFPKFVKIFDALMISPYFITGMESASCRSSSISVDWQGIVGCPLVSHFESGVLHSVPTPILRWISAKVILPSQIAKSNWPILLDGTWSFWNLILLMIFLSFGKPPQLFLQILNTFLILWLLFLRLSHKIPCFLLNLQMLVLLSFNLCPFFSTFSKQKI